MLTGLLFSKAFTNPPKSLLEQWHPWRVSIGPWGTEFVPTDYAAHYCVIGHGVGIIATHGVSQTVAFATYHPTHPLQPTPPHPTSLAVHPLY